MCLRMQVSIAARDFGPLEVELKGSCEPSNMASGKQPQVPCKSGLCS